MTESAIKRIMKNMEREQKKYDKMSQEEKDLYHLDFDAEYGCVDLDRSSRLFEKGLINRTQHYKLVKGYLIMRGLYDINDIIIDDSYFEWIEDITKRRNGHVMHAPGWGHGMNEYDYYRHSLVTSLVKRLAVYAYKYGKFDLDNIGITRPNSYNVLYKNNIYLFMWDDEVGFEIYLCKSNIPDEDTIIYEDLKEFCIKSKEESKEQKERIRLYNMKKGPRVKQY